MSDLSRRDDLPPETLQAIRRNKENQKQRVPYSEFDNTRRRRNNIIDIFYDHCELDSYIAANLYGGYGGDTPYNQMQYENFHYVDMAKINPSQGSSIGSPQSIAERKMSPFETYIALIKGYCVLLVLILPKAFASGGFLASSILLIVSGVFSAASACLLAEAG